MGRPAPQLLATEDGEDCDEGPQVVRRRAWRGRAALASVFVATAGLAWLGCSTHLRLVPQSAATEVQLWEPSTEGEPLDVKVLTYNTFWWNLFGKHGGRGGMAGKLIGNSSSPPFDLMGFQECEDPARVLSDAGLLHDYIPLSGWHNIAVAYRKAAWQLLGNGQVDVAEDQWGRKGKHYFGKRAVQWMRLQHKSTKKTVLFMNHHGPLPVGTGGKWGGWATAHNILNLAQQQGKPGDAVILVGDFNANWASPTVKELQAHLSHVFTGTFFSGIDNIFSNVKGNVVATENLGHGGSDHDALSAVLRLGPASVPPLGLPPPLLGISGLLEPGVEYETHGGWRALRPGHAMGGCIRLCLEEAKCKSWSWVEHAGDGEDGESQCWLKGTGSVKKVKRKNFFSGMPKKGDRGHCHCQCQWATSAQVCGADDGSCCWPQCCGHLARASV